MTITETTPLTDAGKAQLIKLWNNEYPAQLSYSCAADFEQYLSGICQKIHYLLVDEASNLYGWLFVFEREGENWFGMILDSSVQRRGYGSRLLNRAKKQFSILNGWITDHNNYLKADGRTYESPIPFYLKNGFTVLPGQRLTLPQLEAVKVSWQAIR